MAGHEVVTGELVKKYMPEACKKCKRAQCNLECQHLKAYQEYIRNKK